MPSGAERKPSWFDSRPSGDVALCVPPPYLSKPWLGAGLPLLSALLEKDGISTRIVRLLADPYSSPSSLIDFGQESNWNPAPVDQRRQRMQQLAAQEADFFERLIERVLAGHERVIGLSAWRTNADVVVELARQLKQRRPELLIVVGGPEASENPLDFRTDWIDAVVTGAAEGVVASVMRAMLEGRPSDATVWDNVWVHPRHGPMRHLLRRKAEMPPVPRIDYTRIVPLLLDDVQATAPVLLNIGCPFRCSFCVNTNLYPELEFGETQRLVDEMVEIMGVWKDSFPEGQAPPLKILLCDAAANAYPNQFDDLCRRMIAAEWPLKPYQVNGLAIIDGRITPERVHLAGIAGFDMFFGLESAAPRIRKVMKKPGTIEVIRKALTVIAEGRAGFRVTPGIIVGWPDETEAEFHETVAFLDWMISLGTATTISVTPLTRSAAIMDEDLLGSATGAPAGLNWVMPTAAGDPAVRARRYLHVFDHFSGIVNVSSSLPPSILIKHMLPGEPPGFWQRWLGKYQSDGDVFVTRTIDPAELLVPPPVVVAPEPPPPPPPPEPPPEPEPAPEPVLSPFMLEAERLMTEALTGAGGAAWTLQGVRRLLDGRDNVAFEFVSPRDGRTVAILLEPRAESSQAFARTAAFNVLYLSELGEKPCVFDKALIQDAVARVTRAEPGLQQPQTGAA